MKKLFTKKNFYLFGALFIALFFFYITFNTPLAGDDWGYALGGDHPFLKTLEFYETWSGRIFSELWGFLIAPHKWLWNILNPLLFVLIFIGIYYLCNINNKPILAVLLLIAMMLNVRGQLRMETYTWIMGDTYVIPLCLSIWYFVIIRKLVTTRLIDGYLKFGAIISNLLLFIIGLMMENIAAIMIVAIIILIIYAFLTRRYLLKYLIINLIFSITSFSIMRLSPGSNARLLRDNLIFSKMNLLEKITLNYPNFLEQTFISHYYTIGIFALIIIGYLINNDLKKKKILRYFSFTIQIMAILSLTSFILGKSILTDPNSLYSMIFWPIYVIDIYLIFLHIDDEVLKERTLFYLTIGGGSALVMLLSPIYGARSSIYVVYYLIILSLIIFDAYKTKNYIRNIIFISLLFLIITRSIRTIKKYHEVSLIQLERLNLINYYKEHPEDQDVWIPRMPIGSIHGSDIEEDDHYHLDCFKLYYDLPQEAKNIHFFYKNN